MKKLESMFDIWTSVPNIDEFFNDYFSVAGYQPNKAKIDKQPNLFLDCCAHYGIIIGKRPQFPLGRFIMLYCFVLKLEHPELSDANFRRRLRIVNNLVNNSVNTLRSDFMKELLAQVEKIILIGIVEQVEEGKARFQSRQMDEERLKLQWTQEHPEITETLYRLEDHPYLNGYVNAVVGEKWENVKWCDRFYSLFNCNHHSVNKALLAIGDYFEKDAWRYQIVKYDSMRTNRDGRYNNYGKYYWRHHNDWPKKDEDKQRELRLKDYNVILMTTEWSTGGYNHDVFLKALYDLAGKVNISLELENYSYSRYNEGGDKLKMDNGRYLTLADNVYKIYDEKNELLDSHQIVQNEAGIDIEERVEIGLQMIKKWIL